MSTSTTTLNCWSTAIPTDRLAGSL
ncbi:hypothetical protein D039_3333A, partial [Vibrio parahaemolyticus EKP-028]